MKTVVRNYFKLRAEGLNPSNAWKLAMFYGEHHVV